MKMPEFKPKDFNHKAMATLFNQLVSVVETLGARVSELESKIEDVTIEDKAAELIDSDIQGAEPPPAPPQPPAPPVVKGKNKKKGG